MNIYIINYSNIQKLLNRRKREWRQKVPVFYCRPACSSRIPASSSQPWLGKELSPEFNQNNIILESNQKFVLKNLVELTIYLQHQRAVSICLRQLYRPREFQYIRTNTKVKTTNNLEAFNTGLTETLDLTKLTCATDLLFGCFSLYVLRNSSLNRIKNWYKLYEELKIWFYRSVTSENLMCRTWTRRKHSEASSACSDPWQLSSLSLSHRLSFSRRAYIK